jgi:hypothetical protein
MGIPRSSVSYDVFGIVDVSTVGNRNDEVLLIRIKDCIINIRLPMSNGCLGLYSRENKMQKNELHYGGRLVDQNP